MPSHQLLFKATFLLQIFVFGVYQYLHPLTPYSNPSKKQLKKELQNMIFIPGGSTTTGITSGFDIQLTDADSTLLSPAIPSRAEVQSFYLGATEVTNREWKAFYRAKVLELGSELAKKKFYPDTTLWLKEFPYSYNEPMARSYFINAQFDNYPVVGISWEQANEYCTWKSAYLSALIPNNKDNHTLIIRLPSEAEWEFAATHTYKVSEIRNRSFYTWDDDSPLPKISALTNIGRIKDINNLLVKEYDDDGSLYTCETASFPANQKGIFDMGGNVSEWTSDDGYAWSYGTAAKGFRKLYDVKELEAYYSAIDTLSLLTPPEKRIYRQWASNDMKVLSTKDTKICKGGSWADGLIYTQIGSRKAIPKDNASTKIGFRVVISDVPDELVKYFPKSK